MSEAVSYQVADADEPRDPKLALDLIIVEKAEGHPRGHWYLAGALARSNEGVGWIGEPIQQEIDVAPELAWGYWWEKEGNGYNYAVFHYWVESIEVAEGLVEKRRLELEQGANPYFGQVQEVVTAAEQAEPPHGAPGVGTVPIENEHDEANVHAFCEQRALTHSMSQVLVWKLASELVRRHPHRLWVDVQGGAMYDRINIIDISGQASTHVAVFNAVGTNTSTPAGTGLLWTQAHRDDTDSVEWLREFERRCGLPPTMGRLPASTASSLAVRWVSTFLTSQVGSRQAWFTQSPDHFDQDRTAQVFPGALAWQRNQQDREGTLVHLGHLNAAIPQLIVSRDGDVWRDNGERHCLPELHRRGASITALLLRTVPDLVP